MSSRNPDLVEAKAQGLYIYHQLNLYSLEHKKFPINLSEIEGDLNKKYNLGSEQIEGWSYASMASGSKCILIRKEIVDGHFVYLTMTGRIAANYKLPDGNDLILEMR